MERQRELRYSDTAVHVLGFRVTMREEWPGPVSEHQRIVRDNIILSTSLYRFELLRCP